MNHIISLNIKEKSYSSASSPILKDFNLEVCEGEKIAVVGESGVGKSSLLNIIGLIDKHYKGEYVLFGSQTDKLSDKISAKWRNQKIGFVLQEAALINSLSVEDNIKLPLLYADIESRKASLETFESIVNTIGIAHILMKKPHDCSGGERSRVVFARGVIMKPQIILADEPTASLDEENKERIVNLLFKMNKEFNTTIITATHDLEVARRYDRIIRLERSK